MLSAVTNRGKVRFTFFPGSANAARLIKFLERLVKDVERKVFLIVDNLKVHHSNPVKEWLRANSGRLEAFYLPKYSPDLNR